MMCCFGMPSLTGFMIIEIEKAGALFRRPCFLYARKRLWRKGFNNYV
ncbi:hypothetical protein ELI_1644 [Eubacterium callanderi]|uniref:Uncharacterized protein n=1 Tax=Eubacterium callanderi TaxID=53442 RepID=E3GLK6_9FIRM|nr:hypothetical protein ELI_1644 [Eubacterium callanderi]